MATSPTMSSQPIAPLHTRFWTELARTSDTPPVVLLHGFTQNVDCWGVFADDLAENHSVFAVDAPGHGRSAHDNADLWRTADLLAVTITAATPDPPVVVGYSMGGRMALHLALAHPDAVAGLVLIGATAGIDDPADRAARREADVKLAERIDAEPLPDFIDAWLSGSLFAGLTDASACRDARLTNRPDGLAASLRHCGTGSQAPLWDRLGELTVPVLVIAGRRDGKFTDLADRLADTMTGTNALVDVIDGNHAVHLEDPKATAASVSTWMIEQFRC